MIFDAHMHVGDFGPLFNVSLDRDGLASDDRGARLRRLLRLLIRTTSTCARSSRRSPRRTRSSGETRACRDTSRRSSASSSTRSSCGLKLHPLIDGYLPNDPSVHPLMELLSSAEACRCSSTPATRSSRCRGRSRSWPSSFPDVPVVMGHMGHGNVVYINAVDRHRRAATRTSTSRPRACRCTRRSRRRSSGSASERVMYGSDAPFHHPAVEILRVRVSGLDAAELDRTCYSANSGRAVLRGR